MSFQPTWYTKISHTYADYKKGDIVIAKDVDKKGAKTSHYFQMYKHLNNTLTHLLKNIFMIVIIIHLKKILKNIQ